MSNVPYQGSGGWARAGTPAASSPAPPIPGQPIYMALNGHELGHIALDKLSKAMQGHHRFQTGIVYKDTEFILSLYIATAEADIFTGQLAYLQVNGRHGNEILDRLSAISADSISGHHKFQEGVVYPLFTLRINLFIDQAGEPHYETDLVLIQVGEDDPPDRLRLAHALPTYISTVDQQTGRKVDQSVELPTVAKPVKHTVEVGDKVRFAGLANGATMIVERITDEGYAVRVVGKPNTMKIGVGSKAYVGLEVVEKGGGKQEVASE